MIELTLFQYYVLIYLLAGTVVGFVLESLVRGIGEDGVNMKERISLIVLWPIMLFIFIANFIKGLFN